MKKLLCVLMFGMMFGQDAITTREYEIPFNSNITEIDFSDYTSLAGGIYQVELLSFIVNDVDFDEVFEGEGICRYFQAWSGIWLNSYSEGYNNYINIMFEASNAGGIDYVGGSGSALISQENYVLTGNFSYQNMSDQDCVNSFSGIWLIRISGRFDDTDVGLQGDMNDDGELDVLDVVSLVQEILDGGVGDVGDLLNIVTG